MNKSDSVKPKWHPNNKHQGRYDIAKLIDALPELKIYLKKSPTNTLSIDFSNPQAVLSLNKALLKTYYGLDTWSIPDKYLCPAIPGRAEYIHHIHDLLNTDKSVEQHQITCLDIGTGSSMIYPIIAAYEYGWKTIGVDVDEVALVSAGQVLSDTSFLKDKIELRKQNESQSIFKNVVSEKDKIDISICNPPFHSSQAEFLKASKRKHKNLHGRKAFELNFGGQSNELWCPGGELGFIQQMVMESSVFKSQISWFSNLVSKEKNVKPILGMIEKVKGIDAKVIDLNFGNKQSRILAWRF